TRRSSDLSQQVPEVVCPGHEIIEVDFMWMYGGKDADVFTGPGKTGGIVFHSVMFRERAEMVNDFAAGSPTVAQGEDNVVGDHAVGTFHRGYNERFIAWCGIGGK